MGFRVIIVLAMGLGAMYMLHLLARDWDRIRRPVTRALSSALFRSKREINTFHEPDTDVQVDWNRILSRDPFECLQSLLCQIVAGAEHETSEGVLLNDFLRANLDDAPPKIQQAYTRGLIYKGTYERCYSDYPFCLYSAKIMFKVLRWLISMTGSRTTQAEEI